MPSQQIVVTISPESNESCCGCILLKGLNVAQCLAGFTPQVAWLKTIRPRECVDAVKTLELARIYINTINQPT